MDAWIVTRVYCYMDEDDNFKDLRGVFVGDNALERAKSAVRADIMFERLSLQETQRRHADATANAPIQAVVTMTDDIVSRPLQWQEDAAGNWQLLPDEKHPHMPTVCIERWVEGELKSL